MLQLSPNIVYRKHKLSSCHFTTLYVCLCVCVCVFKLASGNTGRWVGKSLIAAYRVIHSVYMCVSVCVCGSRDRSVGS